MMGFKTFARLERQSLRKEERRRKLFCPNTSNIPIESKCQILAKITCHDN
jgi:hypothetical protein